MFLKSIEMRGFKSFADKTILSFDKGITAVVGPNGSGKSNITDAVKWVLGEQSVKSLRGGKMEDVIFSGTQYRKQVGLAYVALTLDNSSGELPIDYNDVTVSRRLYRSGESEYYINNVQCRLKDVQELFMDTGIGKEGYSIIGQGKIDAILSGRPEERRNLIEEAAGIVKYKTRKEESEKRLKNTNQNLIRINDILNTYEERLEPLKAESEKAKLFVSLSGQLKDKEINIIVFDINNVEHNIGSLSKLIEKSKDEIDNLNNIKSSLQKDKDNLGFEIKRQQNKIESEKQEYYNKKSEYQNIEYESKIFEEKVNNFKNLLNKNNSEIKSLDDKINNFKNDKNEIEKLFKDYNNENALLEKDIVKYEKEIKQINESSLEIKNLLNKLKDQEIKLFNDISNEKNTYYALQNEISINKNKLSQIEDLKKDNKNYITDNSNRINILKDELSDIEKSIKDYNNNILSKENKLISVKKEMQDDENTLIYLNDMYDKFKVDKTILVNSEKQYEGYNKSVKNIINHINRGKLSISPNDYFILGEVITVKKELEVAIEIALGSSISNIITSDEHIARTLINYLKNNNLGRATFLPMSIINDNNISISENIKKSSGYLGIASELVEYDKKFKKAIEYVLGRTIIAEDMESALEISKKTNFRHRIVTLSGEIINTGGSLTGGSLYKKSTNVLGRKRKINKLSKKMDELTLNISSLENNTEQNRIKISEIEQSCLKLNNDINNKNIESAKLNEKIKNINNDIQKYEQYIQGFKKDIFNINLKLNSDLEKLEEKDKLINRLKCKSAENKSKMEYIQKEIKKEEENIYYRKENLTNLKVDKAKIEEIINSNKNEIKRLENEIIETRNKKISLINEIQYLKEEISTKNELIDLNHKKLQNISEDMSRRKIIFEEYNVNIVKLNQKYDNIIDEIEENKDVVDKKEKQKNKYDISIAKMQFEKESLYKKLNDNYELTFAEALKFKKDGIDIKKYKTDIKLLKSQINELGVVNVSSIEEYKEVKSKYNFMNSQIGDLLKAKQELLDVIDEMTEKMKVIFNKNFNNIRTNFNETFKELFQGGSADLILQDGDELTADIEINVQPPGKKLQNINLMSGGEKVLSAIALLFAILKMKPTPFCVLDEIEASLDDVNVIRYSEFLKKFSDDIQFIVITHRKGTMEASDVLYGVTMEEKGISKIVSVDLNNR